MKERVSVIIGKQPIILVAPHGADDINTDLIVERTAQHLNCFAIINRGFERAATVDVDKDQADCNRIDHAKAEVVFEEFLKPILKFKERIVQRNYKGINPWYMQDPLDPELAHIFYIHGCGDLVHKEAGERVQVIVGYGLGNKKDSLTCEVWRKNLLVDLLRSFAYDGDVYEGEGGGKYAGRDSNNMNQYFRKHAMDGLVQSFQLEFPYSCRKTEGDADNVAAMLNGALASYLNYSNYEQENCPKFI